jgi:transcriptional regulator with XRE-family HTH domain
MVRGMSTWAFTLNANIRAEMGRRNLSGKQVAGRIGISQPSFSRRLNGEAEWSINELHAMAEVLGCPLASLLPVEAVA